MLYCCWFPTTRWCVWADRPVGLLAVLDSDHDDDDDDRQHHEPPDTHRRYETHTQRLLTETLFSTMSMLLQRSSICIPKVPSWSPIYIIKNRLGYYHCPEEGNKAFKRVFNAPRLCIKYLF